MKFFKRNGHIFLAASGFLFIAFAFTSAHHAYAASGPIANDESSVNTACSSEAAAAGCTGESAGHGLMKCIRAYKKVNKKAFKISPDCRAAIKQLGSDAQARRGAK